jgi:hypothetical protein
MRHKRKIAAASNGKQALALIVLGGKPCLFKYAPKSFGNIENRNERIRLTNIAAAKLGFKHDRRCKGHWRYIGGDA